jgi:hypothetical protein
LQNEETERREGVRLERNMLNASKVFIGYYFDVGTSNDTGVAIMAFLIYSIYFPLLKLLVLVLSSEGPSLIVQGNNTKQVESELFFSCQSTGPRMVFKNNGLRT